MNEEATGLRISSISTGGKEMNATKNTAADCWSSIRTFKFALREIM